MPPDSTPPLSPDNQPQPPRPDALEHSPHPTPPPPPEPSAPEHPTQPDQPQAITPLPNMVTSTAQPEQHPDQVASPAPSIVGGTVSSADSNPKSSSNEYLSNPFLNAVRGLVFTLDTNPVPALLGGLVGFLVIILAYIVFFILSLTHSSIFEVIGGIVLALTYLIPVGAYYVIGGSSARQAKITTGQAYSKASKKLFPFLALVIISSVLGVVGLLLLIVPGLIFLARASLAPLVLFEENLGPIAALKRSFSLTKGHTHEMLGAMFAGAFIGDTYYSLLFGAISVSPLVGRYNDLRELKESGAPKPKTHWLNYLWLLGVVLVIVTVAIVIVAAHNTQSTLNTSGSFNSTPQLPNQSQSNFYSN